MTRDTDGGYHAIKGYIYQFDKSITEILTFPDKEIYLEQGEDIEHEPYVIQVKHHETQIFSNSKIKKPIIQLLEIFQKDESKKFCLYCHFKDKNPGDWDITKEELDIILGNDGEDYSAQIKEEFANNTVVRFSEDYETQLHNLIDLLISTFSFKGRDEAFIYHSIIRSRLLDVSIRPKTERKINKSDIEKIIQSSEKTIFYQSYANYLDKSKYERFIKKEFFTFKHANLDDFERLFIIEWDKEGSAELISIINRLSSRYFKKDKSPQPYVCIRNINKNEWNKLRTDLFDRDIKFNDGTFFDGDKFRVNDLIKSAKSDKSIKIKIVHEENISLLMKELEIQEIYQFYVGSPVDIGTANKHIKIQISESAQVRRFLP
jgi:hypothetical protein